MRIKVKIATKNGPLNIRSGPSTSSGVSGSIPMGQTTVVVEERNTNGYVFQKLEDGRGWICKQAPGVGYPYSVTIEDLEKKTTNNSPDESASDSLGLDSKIISMLYDDIYKHSTRVDGSTRLFGCPFQFTEQTDFRLNTQVGLGRKYLENIICEAPIVYFLPGKPNYLPDVSDVQKKAFKSFFESQNYEDPLSKEAMQQILNNEDVRYFDFIPDYAEYIRYVNLLCRMCAIYIGVQDLDGPDGSTKYKYYDWGNYKYKNDYIPKGENKKSIFNVVSSIKDDIYEAFFGNYNYTQFYVEPNTSFSESASNATTTSMLESAFDGAEGIVKELSFLMGTGTLKNTQQALGNFTSGLDNIKDRIAKNSGEGFFTRLLGASTSTLSGANLSFPELWSDSDYSKSYNVTINLVSPYGDKESIYLNILVPMMHILALTLPRQATANSYATPFLVKVFSKGWFSCEMGLVDSISIDKGGSGESWTVDGLPSEVKITLGIKDLYTNLMISSTKQSAMFFQNQGLIDFLAVSCGVDITKPNLMVKLETMFAAFLSKPQDIASNFYNEMIEAIRNQIEGIYKF